MRLIGVVPRSKKGAAPWLPTPPSSRPTTRPTTTRLSPIRKCRKSLASPPCRSGAWAAHEFLRRGLGAQPARLGAGPAVEQQFVATGIEPVPVAWRGFCLCLLGSRAVTMASGGRQFQDEELARPGSEAQTHCVNETHFAPACKLGFTSRSGQVQSRYSSLRSLAGQWKVISTSFKRPCSLRPGHKQT
jgi:hypothetical protein